MRGVFFGVQVAEAAKETEEHGERSDERIDCVG